MAAAGEWLGLIADNAGVAINAVADANGCGDTCRIEPIQLVCHPALFASAPETEGCRHAPITTPAELSAFERGSLSQCAWLGRGPGRAVRARLQVNLDRRDTKIGQVFFSRPGNGVAQLGTGGGLPRPGLIGPGWSIFRSPPDGFLRPFPDG